MLAYNPSAPICGHVAVHLHPLANISIDGDSVDSAQSVSIHQMLGTILRISKHASSCEIGDESFNRGTVLLYSHSSSLKKGQLQPWKEVN